MAMFLNFFLLHAMGAHAGRYVVNDIITLTRTIKGSCDRAVSARVTKFIVIILVKHIIVPFTN